jgi:hypothetical protein
MLRTQEEIDLLANAREPGIREPQRCEYGIENIFTDFMAGVDFRGHRVLELGPGHYEFCRALRDRGGIAEAVELDPVVIELGRRQGFAVHPGDLVKLPELRLGVGYDGLFCKGSNNPFWFHGDEAALHAYTQAMLDLVKQGGWLWVVSCPYMKPGLASAEFKRWLVVEAGVYREFGFTEWLIPHRAVAAYYGVSQAHPRLSVFTKGLPTRRWSAASLALFP